MNNTTYEQFDKPKNDFAAGELADFSTRFNAFFIDAFIPALTAALIFGTHEAGSAAGFIIGLIYQVYFLTQQNGQTPGKRLMGIRVVRIDGRPLDVSDAFLRYIGYAINTVVFLMGWSVAYRDPNRQGWHDKLARTIVVRA